MIFHFGKEGTFRAHGGGFGGVTFFSLKRHWAITKNCNMREKFKNLKTNIWYWSLIIFGKKACLNCGNKVDFKEHEKAIEDGLNVDCICGCSEFL